MSYSAQTFVADEQPTTAKWNILWSNDASFNDGTGIADNAILDRMIPAAEITGPKLGQPVAFSAYRATNQTGIVDSTPTKVAYDTEHFDLGSNFNTTSNRFVAPYAGVYNFNAGFSISGTDSNVAWIEIRKNGSLWKYNQEAGGSGATYFPQHGGRLAIDMSLAVSDYIEIYANANTAGGPGGSLTILGGITENWFSGHLVGRTD